MKVKILVLLLCYLVTLNDSKIIRHKRSRKFIRHASQTPIENENSGMFKKDNINLGNDYIDAGSDSAELSQNKFNEAMDKDFLDLSDPSDSQLLSDYDDILLKTPSATDSHNVKKDTKGLPSESDSAVLKGWKAERTAVFQSSYGKLERKNETQTNSLEQKVMQSSLNAELQQDVREGALNDTAIASNETVTTSAPTTSDQGVTSLLKSNESETIRTESVFKKEQYYHVLKIIQDAVFHRAAFNQKESEEYYSKQDEEAKNNQTGDDSVCQNVTLSDCRFEQVSLVCKTRCSAFNETVEATSNCDFPASNNSCCAFPFMYQGKIYRSCTTIHKNISWCSLTHNHDADGSWAYCESCSPWDKWSPCSASCGPGDSIRTRNCTNMDGVKNVQFQKIPCVQECNNTVCLEWTPWSECTKPCGSGVQTRTRNCSLPEGNTQTFYEHQVCNVEECPTTPQPVISETPAVETTLMPSVTSQSRDDTVQPVENTSCLLAYLSFDFFQELYREVKDESEENNDMSISYQGPKMYNGNFTCGYSAYFFRHASFLNFREDIFRNSRVNNDLSISFWMKISYDSEMNNPQKGTQTLIYLDKTASHFGIYHLFIDQNKRMNWIVTKRNPSDLVQTQVTSSIMENMQQCSVISSVVLIPEEWYHVGAVHKDDPSTVSLYINDNEITGGPTNLVQEVTPTKNSDSGSNLMYVNDGIKVSVSGTKLDSAIQFQGIGNSPALDSQFFGIMDELYITKCALDNNQIKSLANVCRIREDSNCTSPLLGFCPNCPSCHHGPNKIGDLDLVVPHFMRIPHMIA